MIRIELVVDNQKKYTLEISYLKQQVHMLVELVWHQIEIELLINMELKS